MPTYEYECRDCGGRFERFQRITEPALDTCPSCKGPARRVISAGAGFLFKGSGFYATDYRSDRYRKDRKKEKEKERPSQADKTCTGDPPSCGACPPQT